MCDAADPALVQEVRENLVRMGHVDGGMSHEDIARQLQADMVIHCEPAEDLHQAMRRILEDPDALCECRCNPFECGDTIQVKAGTLRGAPGVVHEVAEHTVKVFLVDSREFVTVMYWQVETQSRITTT